MTNGHSSSTFSIHLFTPSPPRHSLDLFLSFTSMHAFAFDPSLPRAKLSCLSPVHNSRCLTDSLLLPLILLFLRSGSISALMFGKMIVAHLDAVWLNTSLRILVFLPHTLPVCVCSAERQRRPLVLPVSISLSIQ